MRGVVKLVRLDLLSSAPLAGSGWGCRCFNMEGRTDGKNLRAILGKLLPRNVIVVHGTEEAVREVSRLAAL